MLVRQLIEALKQINPEGYVSVSVNDDYDYRVEEVKNEGHYTVLKITSIPQH